MYTSQRYSYREHRLAVFTFLLSFILLTAFSLTGCGSPEEKSADRQEDMETQDVYSLEVRKDRLEKDKYLMTSPNTPIKASDMEFFSGLDYFPVDKRYAFLTALRPLEDAEEVVIATSQDRPRQMLHIGELPFSINGEDFALQVYAPKDTSDGNYWFIPFTDNTSGAETYGGGRYLDIEEIYADSVFLDFNYAYSPYCAYNERYDCPIPPPENALTIPIPAGEKIYPLYHGK
ncbi:DUF1684 domain-containing protein [bacterium]|nr:DUF1684 domain-containing protein [bacterium]